MSSLPRASSGPCRLLPRALGPPAPVAPTLPVGGLSVSVPGPGLAGPRFSGCPEPSPHRPLLRGREVTPGWWARTHLLREGLQRALTGAGPSETGSRDAACRSLLAEGRGEVGKVSPASLPPLPFIPIPRSWGLAQGRPLLVCAWEDTPGGRSSLHLGQGSGVRGQVGDPGTWPSSVAPCSPRWLVRLCVSRRPRGRASSRLCAPRPRSRPWPPTSPRAVEGGTNSRQLSGGSPRLTGQGGPRGPAVVGSSRPPCAEGQRENTGVGRARGSGSRGGAAFCWRPPGAEPSGSVARARLAGGRRAGGRRDGDQHGTGEAGRVRAGRPRGAVGVARCGRGASGGRRCAGAGRRGEVAASLPGGPGASASSPCVLSEALSSACGPVCHPQAGVSAPWPRAPLARASV